MPTQIGDYRTVEGNATVRYSGGRHSGLDIANPSVGLAAFDKNGLTWRIPAEEEAPPFEKEVAADSPEGAALLAQANAVAAEAGLQDEAPVDPFEEEEVPAGKFPLGIDPEALARYEAEHPMRDSTPPPVDPFAGLEEDE